MKQRGWNGYNYNDAEKLLIFAAYEENKNNRTDWLEELSLLLGRPKSNISRYARQFGLTNIKRTSVIPLQILCRVCEGSTTNKKYCSRRCTDIGAGQTRTGQKLWADRPHPRGMLGKTQPQTVRDATSKRTAAMWADKSSSFNTAEAREKRSRSASERMIKRIKERPSSIYSRTQKGWAEFNSGKKYYFRSGWELRYANHLEMLLKGKAILDWQYEVDTFWFEKIRRGVRSYTPDFKVFFKDGTIEYHEVKGWMDQKSKTKLNRMRIYYPEVTVVVIGEQEMKNI